MNKENSFITPMKDIDSMINSIPNSGIRSDEYSLKRKYGPNCFRTVDKSKYNLTPFQ